MREKKQVLGQPFEALRHPYVEYENTRLWRATKKALTDLEENHDLTISELHQYVVGYVCKQLATKGLVTREAVRKPARRKRRAV